MDDAAGQFLEVMHRLEDLRDAMTPERAHAEFDETTLQVFWMKWPGLSAWAGVAVADAVAGAGRASDPAPGHRSG